MKKKIFLICPVRNLTKKVERKTRQYVAHLKTQGHKIHWPPQDTKQDDPIGLRICTDNAKAIIWADEVHIWWQWEEKKWWQKWMWWIKEKKSTGSLFDFGMSFMCSILGKKKIILANPEEVKWTSHKSFNNVLLILHKENIKGEKK